jgi:hypothetical protein
MITINSPHQSNERRVDLSSLSFFFLLEYIQLEKEGGTYNTDDVQKKIKKKLKN